MLERASEIEVKVAMPYYIKEDYIRLMPVTEITSKARPYRILGRAAGAIGVAENVYTGYTIITDKKLTPTQKFIKGGIEAGSAIVEYGAGASAGFVASWITGPGGIAAGIAVTAGAGVVVERIKGQVYKKLDIK